MAKNHESARGAAESSYGRVRELVDAIHNETDDSDDARRNIKDDALSVQVRSGWYSPGATDAVTAPAEYEILLSTGGPASRIIGELDEHGEPTTAHIEGQDWGTPWVEWHSPALPSRATEAEVTAWSAACDEIEPTLLDYARCFYFGEG